MFSERSTIIHLGANMDNLGKILHVNVGATMLTKYSIHELVNSNVNRIMTATISHHHQSYLLRAFKKGVFSILYKEQRNFVVDKSGFASPISLLVKPMYDVGTNMFQYISYLQPIAKTCRYILTNPDGLVECFSENFGEMLGISPKLLNNNGKFVYVQTLMPVFMDFFLEKKIKGGCSNESIDEFMKEGVSTKQYKLNIRQEISTKLICFTDSSGIESFYPFPEEDSQWNQSQSMKMKSISGKATMKNEAAAAMKTEKDNRMLEEIKNATSATWNRLLKWHKSQGAPSAVLYQVDLVFHPIKTSSTYIFVFQIKSVQVLNRKFDALSELGHFQFGHTKTEKAEVSLSKSNLGRVAGRGVVVDGNLVRIPTSSAVSKDPAGSLLGLERIFSGLAPEPQKFEESENKLLKLFADFFQQQIFFEDANRITKKFEHDKSESFEKNESVDSFLQNEKSNELSKNLDSLKDSLGLDVVSQLSSQNKASSTFSANSSVGNSRQEEDITSIPDIVYFPKEYSLLKASSILLVTSSIVATVIVLLIGIVFNSSLAQTITEHSLYKDLDMLTLSTPTLAYLAAFTANNPLSSMAILLADSANTLRSFLVSLSSRSSSSSALSPRDSLLSSPPLTVPTSPLGTHTLALFWLRQIQRYYPATAATLQPTYFDESVQTVFRNAEPIAGGIWGRAIQDWTPDVGRLGLAVLIVLVVGFALSATFAVWVQIQSAKCYGYLNRVYSIVTGFPAHVIKAQKMLVIDLYELLETKIEEKKVQVKIRKSGLRSEEKAKLDLGLKTSGKIVGELEIPKVMIFLGICGLLILILAFDILVLLNMGFFTNSSDLALNLDFELMKLQISLSGLTYSAASRSLQALTQIPPFSAQLHLNYEKLFNNTLRGLEDSIVELTNSDSSFQPLWTMYLADQCQVSNSDSIFDTDLLEIPCSEIQGGILRFGLGRSLAAVQQTLHLQSWDPLPASAAQSQSLMSISSVLRVQSSLWHLVEWYQSFLQNYFSSQASWSVVTNLALVASLAAVSSFGWYFLLKGFQTRVLESKNVIATLPPLILQQNIRARKFLQGVFEEIRRT